MNKEQQQIIDEAYENYCTTLIGSITFSERGKHFKSDGLEFNSGYPNYVHYSQEEFIKKCKTDPEFSEKWGLKIEERELSLEERRTLFLKDDPHGIQPTVDWTESQLVDCKLQLDELNIPTKLITVTKELSDEERWDLYEEKYMFTETIEEKGIDYKYNVPTNKTIESYE